MKKHLAAVAALVLALLAAPSQASLVTSTAGKQLATLGFDTVIPSGPLAYTLAGVGIGVTSTGGDVVQSPAFWDLGRNGFWSLGRTFLGLDAANGQIVFAFSKPVDFAGAFINHFRDTGDERVTIAAYNGNTLLESYTIALVTPDVANGGGFHGIQRVTSDITRLVFSNAYVAVDGFVLATPEPSTYALMIVGLAMFGVAARRRFKRNVSA